MGLMKFLPWIILIAVAYFFISRQKQTREREAMEAKMRRMEQQLAERNRSGSASKSQAMEQCPECGTFFPRDEGVIKNGHLYCSKKCARRAED